MLHCRFSQQVWKETTTVYNINYKWFGLNLQSCLKDRCCRHPTWHMMPSIICFHIWLERNLVLFEEGRVSIASVLHMILGWLGKSKGIKQLALSIKNPPLLKEGRPIGWFDGATQERGQFSGVGGVIGVNKHT